MDLGADRAWLDFAGDQQRCTSRLARHVLTRCESESCASGQARQCWRSGTRINGSSRLDDRTWQLSVIRDHLLRVLPVARLTDGAHMSASIALFIPMPTQASKHLHEPDAKADSKYANATNASSWLRKVLRVVSAGLFLTRLRPAALPEARMRFESRVESR